MTDTLRNTGCLFDVPLLATGEEDLYATLNPSPGLTERQLREILYDHLVTRRAPEPDYEELSREALEELIDYGERSEGLTLGVGGVDPLTGMWRPLLPNFRDRSERRARRHHSGS